MSLSTRTVHGTVHGTFTARFHAGAVTLDLGEFTLYELTFGGARYVGGFARAFNVGRETFGGLTA